MNYHNVDWDDDTQEYRNRKGRVIVHLRLGRCNYAQQLRNSAHRRKRFLCLLLLECFQD